MKRSKRQREGRSGLDLVEEATHLLRTLPAATLSVYFIGSIPFVLGLRYFWVDMSRNPCAGVHRIEGALSVTLLFFWV
jgi:hypothetical protein